MVSYTQKEGGYCMKDPVCGMDVADQGDSLTHNGKEYRFCCASCRWAFEKNPEQFMTSNDEN